jgi:hypothetical protein
MIPAVLTLLDWSASDVVVVEYDPVVHYHALEGPSKKRLALTGTDGSFSTILGPDKRNRTIVGGT